MRLKAIISLILAAMTAAPAVMARVAVAESGGGTQPIIR